MKNEITPVQLYLLRALYSFQFFLEFGVPGPQTVQFLLQRLDLRGERNLQQTNNNKTTTVTPEAATKYASECIMKLTNILFHELLLLRGVCLEPLLGFVEHPVYCRLELAHIALIYTFLLLHLKIELRKPRLCTSRNG